MASHDESEDDNMPDLIDYDSDTMPQPVPFDDLQLVQTFPGVYYDTAQVLFYDEPFTLDLYDVSHVFQSHVTRHEGVPWAPPGGSSARRRRVQ